MHIIIEKGHRIEENKDYDSFVAQITLKSLYTINYNDLLMDTSFYTSINLVSGLFIPLLIAYYQARINGIPT